MFEHVSGRPRPAAKRDGWKSKNYDVDQTRRIKVKAFKEKKAKEQEQEDKEANSIMPPVKKVYDDGMDDDDVMA